MKLVWLAAPLLLLTCAVVRWQASLDRHAELQSGAVATVERGIVGLSNICTDLRFRLRGPRSPAAKVAIVAIDSEAIARYGRWPWHREVMAALIDGIGNAGAKSIGLDVVFAEADPRASEGLRQALAERGLSELADAHETDPMLAGAVAKHATKVVLGWQTDSPCRPLTDGLQQCPVDDARYGQTVPPSHGLFALAKPKGAKLLPALSPLLAAVTVTANLALVAEQARFAGYFNAFLDPDGVVRTAYVVMAVAGKLHPSLALAMAQVQWGGKAQAQLAADGHLLALRKPDGTALPVDASGLLRIGFYGAGRTFSYVSASAVLAADPTVLKQLRDVHVLVGLTALGAHDMRSFPFDANVPGVEGHATILANLLADQAFVARDAAADAWLLILLVLVVGAGLVIALHRLQALGGLVVAGCALCAVAAADMLVFSNGIWFDTGAVYTGLGSTIAALLAMRYFEEQKSRTFIKSAFSRYVSPAVVDNMLAHPDQLTLGGEKKAMTVLFSDIRSFTTVSERLDPRELVAFLNHYLGRMTDIVFDHRGTLDKYIGDAVMAFWGAPLPHADHPRDALQAAVAMIAAVDSLRPGIKARWDIDLQIGIGVATGIVSVGNMGSERNLAYTVLGDRVNLAARLESLTKTYGAQVLTTADTLQAAQACGGIFVARTVDLVCVKGKTEPVELVELFFKPLEQAEQLAFEAARKLYLVEQFSEAAQAFTALQVQFQHRLYPLMLQRCQHYLQHPPPAQWSGAWIMENK